MKTKSGTFVAILSAIALLTSCAQMSPLEAQNDDIHKTVKNARTYTDHDKLAKQYRNAAKEMLVKVEDQKKLLQHYEEKSYLYGRQAQDKQSHISALLHKYEQTAKETLRQAAFHQKMASELAQHDYSDSAETPRERNYENNVKVGSDSKDQI